MPNTNNGTQPLAGKRALVTGAAGFMGSHVADECLARDGGRRDRRPLGRFPRERSRGCRWVQGDLRDAEFVRSLWEHGLSTTSTTSARTPPRGFRTSSAPTTTAPTSRRAST